MEERINKMLIDILTYTINLASDKMEKTFLRRDAIELYEKSIIDKLVIIANDLIRLNQID